MINIPNSIKVARCPDDEKMLVQKAKDWLQSEERSPGIHASELLDLRRAYFQRTDPKPMDDRSALVFLVGKVLHAFILGAQDGRTVRSGVGASGEESAHSAELGIEYSPDRNRGGIIRELKTSRSPFEPKTVGDLQVYLEQLLIYMAAENLLRAKLDVLYISLRDDTNRTTPQIRTYDIVVDQAGLDDVKSQIKQRVTGLKTALHQEDHTKLPLCREFLCSEAMCPWWHKCRPEGRYGNPTLAIKKPRKPTGAPIGKENSVPAADPVKSGA